MTCVEKLLLVLVVALGSNAAAVVEECDGLKKPLPADDLHQIFGDWVLVWATTDIPEGWSIYPNITSSHVELRLHADNKTIEFNERNFHADNSCSNYILNMSSDPAGPSDRHTLKSLAATVEKDGVVQPYNDTGDLDLYESCSDCLVVIYTNKEGRFLMIYRREGHHSDVDQLKASHTEHKKQAQCFGFLGDQEFFYDGVRDFCHKKSSGELKVES
ncbi:saxitoxin and tetrodotoxin-binding protein 1-like [Platichthys flesus]|uniref:saxitoxin and tetrodotoxin-binding protein 1-like n=1 Tax=Platichthys flesus TaxID=8260 RepID=UPI002DBAE0A6|nr:saxitoxin and tetrodotoxin-binding protein 1-like [Platichthys flesus]XP_062266269.1 saxitoxin and tetrodotoxin-binding protein 1-like [Platichthys flesus]